MKNRPEVVYVRSGYSPLRKPKVSPNSQGFARGHFSSRAPGLLKACREAGKQVNIAIVRARASIAWRKAEQDRLEQEAARREAIKAEKEAWRKSREAELKDLLSQHSAVMARLTELGL